MEIDRSFYSEIGSSIFCDIIGRMTDEFMSSLERKALIVYDKNTTTRRSWVSSGTSIRIDD
jgi:hypothetical protein